MKLFVAVTDNAWYAYLANRSPDEVNFWQPRDKRAFRILEPNDLFLFKLHRSNYIAGGGYFVGQYFVPLSLAWEAFGDKNGKPDFTSFSDAIRKYQDTEKRFDPDPVIGCIVLTSPFFFDERDWVAIPDNWKNNIVQGKSYDTADPVGLRLYNQVRDRLAGLAHSRAGTIAERSARYGREQIIRPRLGQGAFRVVVTEAYHRRCAISGERTLPVLDAIHIKPFSMEGPHVAHNGLLLRKDLHTLFDRGYITVSPDLHIQVSKRIKEDFGNGRDYYAFHGRSLVNVPDRPQDRPYAGFLRWHMDNVFLA